MLLRHAVKTKWPAAVRYPRHLHKASRDQTRERAASNKSSWFICAPDARDASLKWTERRERETSEVDPLGKIPDCLSEHFPGDSLCRILINHCPLPMSGDADALSLLIWSDVPRMSRPDGLGDSSGKRRDKKDRREPRGEWNRSTRENSFVITTFADGSWKR